MLLSMQRLCLIAKRHSSSRHNYAITDSPTTKTTRTFIKKAVLEMQGNEPEKYLSYAGYTSLANGFMPQAKYWGPNLARLQKIKASIDPNDVYSTPYGVKAG